MRWGLDKRLKNSEASIYRTLLRNVDCLNLNEIYQVAYYQKPGQIPGHSGDPATRSTKFTRMARFYVCCGVDIQYTLPSCSTVRLK